MLRLSVLSSLLVHIVYFDISTHKKPIDYNSTIDALVTKHYLAAEDYSIFFLKLKLPFSHIGRSREIPIVQLTKLKVFPMISIH